MWTTSVFLVVLLYAGWSEGLAASNNDGLIQQLVDTLNLPNCDPARLRVTCLKYKFRTIDGSCNNLCNITKGSAGRPFRRFPGLDPATAYEPGFLPRNTASFGTLGNPRKISRVVFSNVSRNAPNFTHITMTWGQFLDHDITLTALTPNVNCGVNNAPCPDKEGCIGIPINPGQELRSDATAQCIPLARSDQPNNDGVQMNEITSYVDGSQVYGSDKDTADRLRDHKSGLGLLLVTPFVNSNGQSALPEAEEEEFCRSPKPEEKPCFKAGDIRVNENQALMAMHALWVREHNRIANTLHVLNPQWKSERLYQEARKIVGALLQHITYNEWLAVLFNDTVRANAHVALLNEGNFNDYDPNINPEIISSLSTAALRMGHTMIRDQLRVFGLKGDRPPINIKDFFNPEQLHIAEGGNPYGGIFRGLVTERAQAVDRNFVDAVREFLRIEGDILGDLPAINIQRGRDHGIPGYVNFLRLCGGGPATNFNQLPIRAGQRTRLSIVYNSVEDIDLFVGGMSEDPAPGSELGPTFTCIMLQQFKDLKFGDRFWYERDDPVTAFTYPQLTEIRKCSLARVICDNADEVDRIQAKVFKPRNSANPNVDCDRLPFVDLNAFKEEHEIGAGSEGGGWSGSNAAA